MRLCLYIVASLCSLSVITGQGEVDTGNPYLTDISNFAAAELLEDEDFGLAAQNFSLLRILDAQFVAQPPPTPSLYLLTLEFGSDCNEEVECDSLQICEATVADNTVERKRFLVPDKSRCAGREMNEITEFNGNGIASSLAPPARETRLIAGNAIIQMSAKTGEKVSLRDVQLARKVTDGSSVLYYLTLNVSSRSPNGSSSNEICDVIMEENAEGTNKGEQQLRSFQCFDHDDEADRVGVVRNQQDELSLGAVRHLAQTALPYVEAGLVTRYQLKLLGFSLIGNRVSPDTGMRETRIHLGITPTFCIKRDENEEEDTSKSCTADTEREPSLCRITVIQWPWLPEDNYLFSDLSCVGTNYTAIAKLTPYVEDLPTTAEEDDATEIEEVDSNIARASNREIDGEDDTPCAGCPVDIAKDDPAVRQMAEFALSALDQAANSNYLQVIVRIIQATHQVVAGSKYDITLELADTTCRKTSAAARANRQSCTSSGKNKKICTVSILDQPWIPNREVLNASCGQK